MFDETKFFHSLKPDTKLTSVVAKYIDQTDNKIQMNVGMRYDKHGNLERMEEFVCHGVSRLYSNEKSLKSLKGVWKNRETKKVPFSVDAFPTTISTPEGIVDESLKIHGKEKFWVLCSGGKDSISLVDWISKKFPRQFEGVLHINTTMGIEAGRVWLKQYCKEKGWALKIQKPPFDVLEYIIKEKQMGFPNMWLHGFVMRLAKLDPMKAFLAKHDDGVGLMSGVRAMESIRRMGNYDSPIDRNEGVFFIKPFFYQTTDQVMEYLVHNGLKKSPISEILGYSGECLDGCFAVPDQLATIGLLDYNLYKKIRDLEAWIDKHGTDYCKISNRYGGKYKYSREEVERAMHKLSLSAEMLEKMEVVARATCGVECGEGTMKGMGFA